MKLHGETVRVGKEWPGDIFWDTGDGRPAGQHRAVVVAITKYTGRFTEFFTHVIRLTAPNTRRGWMETVAKLS